jgi:hypothetical protein
MNLDEMRQTNAAIQDANDAMTSLRQLVWSLTEGLEDSARIDALTQVRNLLEVIWRPTTILVKDLSAQTNAEPAPPGPSVLNEAFSLVLSFYTALARNDNDAMVAAFAPLSEAFYNNPERLHALAQALLQVGAFMLVSAQNNQLDGSVLIAGTANILAQATA